VSLFNARMNLLRAALKRLTKQCFDKKIIGVIKIVSVLTVLQGSKSNF
jgi:hypothetical protein